MNIKEAKEQIIMAMKAYLARDEWGNRLIPAARQRPIFLLGAPGIGKTQIMEQIAGELSIPLISYSMTHHNRQSALGLPIIEEKDFGGEKTKVSEYTMSEILATVYETIEETGIPEGILFLDEINCVSETLTPSMLQFLQFKTFGRHALPEGWIVVTAGNPPEYNRTVREFDIVTLDRLKKIQVEPDFEAWKEYAFGAGIHPAVLSYLEIKKDHFYRVQAQAGGKSFVTARGWEDLSRMLYLFEKLGFPVDKKLTSQYLQDDKIHADFAAYYDLFKKYRSDYQIESILKGEIREDLIQRAKGARFDEKIALLGLFVHAMEMDAEEIAEKEDFLLLVLPGLKEVKEETKRKEEGEENKGLPEILEKKAEELEAKLALLQKRGGLSARETRSHQAAISFFRDNARGSSSFADVKAKYQKEALALEAESQEVLSRLHNAFAFLEKAFPQGQELLLFVTELSIAKPTSRFLSHYPSEDYDRHSQNLLFSERQRDIAARASKLLLEEE